MDDSQTNNGNTGRERENQIKTIQQSPADRARKFVRDNVRDEYEYLKVRINEQVKFRNAKKGDLPDFVMVGAQTVQLGHVALTIHLQQRFRDPDTYLLEFGLGSASSKTTMFGPGPEAEDGRMRATASKDFPILV